MITLSRLTCIIVALAILLFGTTLSGAMSRSQSQVIWYVGRDKALHAFSVDEGNIFTAYGTDSYRANFSSNKVVYRQDKKYFIVDASGANRELLIDVSKLISKNTHILTWSYHEKINLLAIYTTATSGNNIIVVSCDRKEILFNESFNEILKYPGVRFSPDRAPSHYDIYVEGDGKVVIPMGSETQAYPVLDVFLPSYVSLNWRKKNLSMHSMQSGVTISESDKTLIAMMDVYPLVVFTVINKQSKKTEEFRSRDWRFLVTDGSSISFIDKDGKSVAGDESLPNVIPSQILSQVKRSSLISVFGG